MEAIKTKRMEVEPSNDGATLRWEMEADGSVNKYLTPSKRLPDLIFNLIRIAGHPDVRRHFEPSEKLNIGSTVNLVAIPHEDFAAAYVETTGNLALIVLLPGSLKFAFAFSPDEASRLFEMLQVAADDAKNPELTARRRNILKRPTK